MRETLKIYGPPGTGKTTRLLQILEQELRVVKPSRLAFLTFTRAARLEALSRTGLTEEDLPFVKTLHAICYKVLNVSRDGLVLNKDLRRFGKSIGVRLSGSMPDLFNLESITETGGQPTAADRLLQLNHLGRHRGMKLRETMKDAPVELDYKYAKWFTESYRAWKIAENLMDYTDLLQEYLNGFPPLDIDVLFIDEAQDLSWLQWQVVHRLGANAKRVYISGDDDQAIFTWAGASAELFNTEPCDRFEVLPQSYRIPASVHRLAHKIIHRVKVRQMKEFKPRDVEGVYKPVGHFDPKLLDASGSTLLLYRNHHRGTFLREQLEYFGVPYSGTQSVIAVEEVSSALRGWVKAEKNQPLPVDEARNLLLFCSPRFTKDEAKQLVQAKSGEVSVSSLFREEAFKTDWYNVVHKMPRMAFIDRAQSKHGWNQVLNPTVKVISIHQSKGGEADTVVLDLEMARRTYEGYQKDPDAEHRVMYVGVTRARHQLFTLLPMDSMSYVL
jgi:DNA helicase-2/ATP-dependent DNA helicase PcrA